jgi:hypothetical protein
MISRPTCTRVLLQGDTTLREIADFIANKKFAKVRWSLLLISGT